MKPLLLGMFLCDPINTEVDMEKLISGNNHACLSVYRNIYMVDNYHHFIFFCIIDKYRAYKKNIIYRSDLPVACAASKSLADVPGFVAFTPKALTLTENLDPVFCRFSLIPLYSQVIAHGIAPNSDDDPSDPNIVFDCPEIQIKHRDFIKNVLFNYS